jgi:two-component system KDP operon response regulator KdpE
MLTVRSAEEDKVAALDAGADDYVTKPFGMPELLARIRAALRRVPVSSDSALIRAGDLEINPAARSVKVSGRDVRLTPKEFDLLHFLATNPNVPIAHTKLLQAVWGPDYGDEVEYLRTFINQVRKKVEADPAHPKHVITEPWVGYKFQI